ncbi:uncharacterized protein [Nothobranchius furzeri]|uniref:uncharacterized protein n=1 Tax=Nothobranchius furzeri TaxID=105023 RepID=UPI0039049F3E
MSCWSAAFSEPAGFKAPISTYAPITKVEGFSDLGWPSVPPLEPVLASLCGVKNHLAGPRTVLASKHDQLLRRLADRAHQCAFQTGAAGNNIAFSPLAFPKWWRSLTLLSSQKPSLLKLLMPSSICALLYSPVLLALLPGRPLSSEPCGSRPCPPFLNTCTGSCWKAPSPLTFCLVPILRASLRGLRRRLNFQPRARPGPLSVSLALRPFPQRMGRTVRKLQAPSCTASQPGSWRPMVPNEP